MLPNLTNEIISSIYLFQYLIHFVNSGNIVFSNSIINISAKTDPKVDPWQHCQLAYLLSLKIFAIIVSYY